MKKLFVLLSVAALGLFAGTRLGNHTTAVHLTPEPDARGVSRLGSTSCGSERAAVKHLTDGFALPTATVMTPEALINMQAPPVTPNSTRLPQERLLVQLSKVHIIAVKQEADSDLHVIISTSAGELNVEAPMAQCDSASPYASTLSQARAAMDAAMPNVSSSGYTPENITATIQGVIFFDVLHGQRGAPNGVELHPVTFFDATGTAPPPPPPPPTTTVTPPPVTTGTVGTTTTTPKPRPGPGCKRYPGRHYLHHKYHLECKASYFTSP